jgi:PAS domain-containing protein
MPNPSIPGSRDSRECHGEFNFLAEVSDEPLTMRKVLPACGFAALLVLGLALFSGQALRLLAPVDASKRSVLDRWIPRLQQVDALRSLAWDQRAWFSEYWLTATDLSAHEIRLVHFDKAWKEAVDSWLAEPVSSREREALERLSAEQREFRRTLDQLDRLRRDVPVASTLFLEQAVRSLRRMDGAIAQLQATAESGIRRELEVARQQRAAVAGSAIWLVLSAIGAAGLFWLGARKPVVAQQVVAAASVVSSPPAPVMDADPLAALGALSPIRSSPEPAPEASPKHPHGYPTAELLNALCKQSGQLLITLDRKEQFTPPVVEWMSDNTDVLGEAPSVTDVAGHKIEDVFPRLRDIFDAAFKGLTPGETRRSEVDLGTKDAPCPCSMVILQPSVKEHYDGRILCQIAPIGELVQVRNKLEAVERELAPMQTRLKEAADAKNQVAEKRRDLIKLIDGFAFEFEVKPDGQTIICTDLPDGIAEIYGVKMEDLFNDGNLLTKLVIKPDRPAVDAALAAGVAEGKAVDVTFGIMTRAGVERWLRLRALPKKTPEDWTRFVCVMQDLTEAHLKSEELAKQRARADMLGGVLDCLEDPVFSVNLDAKNQFAFVNKLAVEHFGYSAEEIGQVQIGNLDAAFDEALAGINLADSPNFTLAGTHDTAAGSVQVSVSYHLINQGGRYLAGFIKERAAVPQNA